MKDFVYQINSNECGYASLKMLLALTLNDSSYLFLPHSEDKNHKYNLLELKEIAKANGVLLAGYMINNQHDLLNLKTPFIFIKTLANGNKHAVLVKKIYKSFAVIYDPGVGKKLVRVKKYFSFEGNVEVLTVESHSFINRTFEIAPLISNKNLAFIVLFEFLAMLSYFLSAYLLKEGFEIIFPIGLMLVGAILAIVYKVATFKTMREFDEKYISFTYSPDKRKRKNNYRLLHKTKSGLLSSICNIILTLSTALLVNVILILQDFYTIYVLVSAVVLVFIDVILIAPRIKTKSHDLEELETLTLSKDNLSEEDYLNYFEDIKEDTYKIARLIDLKRIIMYFVLLIITVIFSILTGNTDVYYIIFHFAMCMFTYVSLDNVYKMADNNKENQINQVKFYNLINEKKEK